MKTKTQKFLSSLSALSALASLTALNGDPTWLTFLSFLSFLGFAKIKTDERWKTNVDRAARNGFIVAFLCVVGLVALLGFKPSFDVLIYALQTTLVSIVISFIISFSIYDKKGV